MSRVVSEQAALLGGTFPRIPGLVESDGMRIHGDECEQKLMFDLFQTTMQQDLRVPFVVLGADLKTRGDWLLSQICPSASGIKSKNS
ncbi:hypothetical protein ACA910_010554 [Epithemia clementina (nom. ined.)]